MQRHCTPCNERHANGNDARCSLPILRHEPFNVKESWHVWNYTSILLKAGPSFCSAAAAKRKELFSTWRKRQVRLLVYIPQ